MISIIVPCYKQAEFLNECLESVISQTYRDWECIIINDESPDNTEEIAKIWIEKDSRFKYFKKNKGGGPASARNYGIKLAKGEWILPLDADDKIGERYLELCYNAIKEKKGNLIHAQVMTFGLVDKIISHPSGNILYTNNFTNSYVFEKSKWELVGGYDENLTEGLEDWKFWINLVCNTDIKVHKIKGYVGFYYRRKLLSRDTIMNSSTEKFNKNMEYIISKHAKHYANNICSIRDQLHLLNQMNYKVGLLKKSRLIKLLNSFGLLKWIEKI